MHFPTHIIGLMSGTSADGVDAAILHTDGRDVAEAGASLFVPYGDGLRAEILALMRGAGDKVKIAHALTEVHRQAVNQLIEKANISRETILLVGFHGQTIRHAPAEGITEQIGDAQFLADTLGIPVVADFRSNDVHHGGQGAPLVPLYHAALAQNLPKPLMVVNIGGVANVTWIGQSPVTSHQSPASTTGDWRLATGDWLLAFDCGPGNALLDDWIFRHTGKRCDEGGEIASRGVVDAAAVGAFLRDPFFLLDAPKSLDRLHFEARVQQLVKPPMSVEDGAATLASMTATSIALSFGAVPEAPREVLITGGGRHNPYLMGLLKACVNAPVRTVEDVGWNGDMLEAEAFAYLAARSVLGLPLSLPTTTGVRAAVTGGQLFRPQPRA